MIALVVYMFCAYGIANTVIYANGPFHVFAKMHQWAGRNCPQLEEMLSCFICLPWWIGFFFSGLNELFFNCPITPTRIVSSDVAWYYAVFMDGAFTSASCWLINTIQDWFEQNTPKEEE